MILKRLAEIPSAKRDLSEDLEILTNTHLEKKTREKTAIAIEMKKELSNLEKLKDDLKSVVLGFLPKSVVLGFLPLIENIKNRKHARKCWHHSLLSNTHVKL